MSFINFQFFALLFFRIYFLGIFLSTNSLSMDSNLGRPNIRKITDLLNADLYNPN